MLDRALNDPPRENLAAASALSAMMFLQYAVWGVWLPSLAIYLTAPADGGGLGFTGGQVGWILGLAGAIGAVTAPFIAGQVADRYLNAERALAGLLLVGGAINFALAYVHNYYVFLLLSVLYSICYMPTLSLTNGISFAHLRDSERTFPWVRLWGTVGWIVASNAFALLWLAAAPTPAEKTARIADALKVAGVASAGYALFSLLVLPKTPPKRDVAHPLAFARAFALLRHRGFLIVTLVALPIAMIHQTYFFRAPTFLQKAVGVPVEWVNTVLSIGQFSEIAFLALLGFFLKRLGYRGVLALGCAAYAIRFGIFGLGGPKWLVIASQALHGLCYGCFFAGSFLYVEQVAPRDIRHSAQTVFGIIILGLGPILAGLYNQFFDRFHTPLGTQSYSEFWYANAAIAAACGVALLLAFPRGKPLVHELAAADRFPIGEPMAAEVVP